ncbi:hypothetical protein, partial [Brucella sp. NBRC 12950]|uniref:hypothetical protein n=1 Tax=Brucella sp. NBRC 12950 TaxID=2994518 RepID=UPI00255587F7
GALHLVTASRIPGHPQEITPKTKGYTFKVDTLNCRAKKAALTDHSLRPTLRCQDFIVETAVIGGNIAL